MSAGEAYSDISRALLHYGKACRKKNTDGERLALSELSVTLDQLKADAYAWRVQQRKQAVESPPVRDGAMCVPERYRVTVGPLASTPADGNNGVFIVPMRRRGVGDAAPVRTLQVIASDGDGWEHVSVSVQYQQRCATWDEMKFVRDLCWSPDVTVVQFHPPAGEYVNVHEYCLHLWRQVGTELPRPRKELVG